MVAVPVVHGRRRLASAHAVLPSTLATNDTRGRILAHALQLFAERGFAGASIRDIASAAGIRTATLYGHFLTKAHILSELTEAGHRAHHEHLVRAIAGAGIEPAAQLAALVRAHVRFHAGFPMLAIVSNVELHALSDERVAASLAIRAESERLFFRVIERGVTLRSFETPDSWMSVAAIAGMGMRVANWYGPESELTVDEVADTYAEFALRIVAADRSAQQPSL